MIDVINISVKKGRKSIIHDASVKIKPGQISVVIGKNGAGKSTLLEAISRSLPLESGQILFDGHDLNTLHIKTLAQKRAVLSQKVSTGFSISVHQLVEMGTYVSDEYIPKIKLDSLIQHALHTVDMTSTISRDFNTLSGGEQQRVLLAKCIVQLNCCHWADMHKYLLLDEPTASLDIEQQFKFIELVKNLVRRRNIGVFAILHDLNLAAQFADEIILIRKGKILDKGTPKKVLTPAKLAAAFDINAIVNSHPTLNCLHITTIPKTINATQPVIPTKKAEVLKPFTNSNLPS
jgi:iron complex transport system ATP-binding protein